jgi:hypothetical protein
MLGISMDSMGKIYAWGAGFSAFIYFPMGWVCGRVNPLRLTLGAITSFAAGTMLAYLLIHGQEGFWIYTIAITIPSVGWWLGWLATAMVLFPNEKFAQFFSGLNVFGCGALIVGNYAIGKCMDLVHSNYRMAFLWSSAIQLLAIYPMMLVYREWKRHGGPEHYVAPLPPT